MQLYQMGVGPLGWITKSGAPATATTATRAGADAGTGAALLERLASAVNRHDLDDLADCFAPGYRNETPAHPAQGFTGHDQVRRNWEQIFAFVPDITAQVLRSCADGDVIWSEWDMTGTRRDGSTHHMAGVIVFGVRENRFTWARFYLEPVETGGPGVTGTVRQRIRADATPPTTPAQPGAPATPDVAGPPDAAGPPTTGGAVHGARL
jgi:ketosteroid isomerase-like protein